MNNLKIFIDTLIHFASIFVSKEKSSKSKVLIIRKDVLGDFILFLPTLKEYRRHFKDDYIIIVCHTITRDLAPLIQKYVDKIIWYDQPKFRRNIFYRFKFMLSLKKEGAKIVIHPVFSRERIGDLMVKITGAEERIGINTTGLENNPRNSAYTRLISIPESVHLEIFRNFYIASEITGIPSAPYFPFINPRELPEDNASDILEKNNLKNGKFCLMFPGVGFYYRAWPIEKFSELADYIFEKSFKIVIAGKGRTEKEMIDKIIQKSKNGKKFVNIVNQTSLGALTHILDKAQFYFGSETGILHLATAIGKPTVTILGGGSFDRFFPYGDPNKNLIVYDREMKCKGDDWRCAENLKPGEIAPCIKNIKVEDAKIAVDKMINYLNSHV